MTTIALERTAAYASFADSLAKKAPLNGLALVTAFTQLDSTEQFDALVLAFETLVLDLRDAEISADDKEAKAAKTAWASALVAALDGMAVHFLDEGFMDEDQREIGTFIEDAAFAGLRGTTHARGRHLPYSRKELLPVLLAAFDKGHPNLTLSTSRLFAQTAFGPDYAGFRSALAAPIAAAPALGDLTLY
ncbi:hypothetical protein [Pseudarthrobacter phenanthrenivorans]|uniref:Uncharacterized protein n=1 Tax=Pseudarthrobacter phenanthrenivorans TaxID=361575 RepID=A0A0B4EPS8_PSEPS|nr:hypothetical protein [Pseudarthrobacter phenanthrenivorans]KIC68708.1 hypothetical protein RM50_04405 [Pseudarthrobacter phenanthrenivorans]